MVMNPTVSPHQFNKLMIHLSANGRLEDVQRLCLGSTATATAIDITDYPSDAFMAACSCGHVDVAKWLQSLRPMDTQLIQMAFRRAVWNGHLQTIQWLFGDNPNLFYHDMANEVVQDAIVRGHLPVAQWLHRLNPTTMDVNEDRSYEFQVACAKGRLDIIKWMVQVNPNIQVSQEDVIWACQHQHKSIAMWLLQMHPHISREELPNYAEVLEIKCLYNNLLCDP
jgi:hypothetical protein